MCMTFSPPFLNCSFNYIFIDFFFRILPVWYTRSQRNQNQSEPWVVTMPSLASFSKDSTQMLLDGFQGPSFICDWRWAALARRALQQIDRRFPRAWTCDLMLSQCAKSKKGEQREMKEKVRNRKKCNCFLPDS